MKLKIILLVILITAICKPGFAEESRVIEYAGVELTLPIPEGFTTITDEMQQKMDPINYNKKSTRDRYFFYSLKDIEQFKQGHKPELLSKVMIIPFKLYSNERMDLEQFAEIKEISKNQIKNQYAAKEIKKNHLSKNIDYDKTYIVDSYMPYFETAAALLYATYTQYSLKSDSKKYVQCDICANVCASDCAFLLVYTSSLDNLDEVKYDCQLYIKDLIIANTCLKNIPEENIPATENSESEPKHSVDDTGLHEQVEDWKKLTIAHGIYDSSEKLKLHHINDGEDMSGVEFNFVAPARFKKISSPKGTATFSSINSADSSFFESLNFYVHKNEIPAEFKNALIKAGLQKSMQNYYLNDTICYELFDGKGVVKDVYPKKVGMRYAVSFERTGETSISALHYKVCDNYLLLIVDERVIVISISQFSKKDDALTAETTDAPNNNLLLLLDIATTLNIEKY